MRNRVLVPALEAIHFQSTKFFEELTDCFKALWEQKYKLSYQKLIETPEAQAILECCSRHTKMKVSFSKRYENEGPAIISAPLNPNHIFFFDSARDSRWFADHFVETYGKLRKEAVFGSVDLTNAKVGGYFTEVENELLLPTGFLSSGRCYGVSLTAEECAAITLHEFGHAFTFFEFTARLSTGNQVLAYLSTKLSGGNAEQFNVALVDASRVMNYTQEQQEALKKAKTPAELAVISIAAIQENIRAELGVNMYDATSCEQLADQFATRLGAGPYLVTALEKIGGLEAFYGHATRFGVYGEIIRLLLLTLVAVVAGPMGWVVAGFNYVLLLLNVAFLGEPIFNYDNSEFRPKRIKQDLIERLKDRQLTPAEKKATLAQIEVIDKILENKHEYNTLNHYVAILLKSSYRKAYNYEVMQKQLEALANNNLFVKATKLETINHQPA